MSGSGAPDPSVPDDRGDGSPPGGWVCPDAPTCGHDADEHLALAASSADRLLDLELLARFCGFRGTHGFAALEAALTVFDDMLVLAQLDDKAHLAVALFAGAGLAVPSVDELADEALFAGGDGEWQLLLPGLLTAVCGGGLAEVFEAGEVVDVPMVAHGLLAVLLGAAELFARRAGVDPVEVLPLLSLVEGG